PRWMVTLRGRQDAAGEAATRIGLIAANSEAVMMMVRSGEAALGFIETVTVPTDLRVRSLGFDELRLAVAPQHPWAKRHRPITAQELARTPLVTREPGSGTRQSLEQLLLGCEGIDTIASPRVELTSTAAVRAAIAAGTAPGVLSALALADDLALGRLRALKVEGVSLRRQLSAVWPAGRTPASWPAQDLLTVALAG
ncbi:MAG: LysR substrate-binding domain-containing protein, partial [Terrimesophilobacter sp.]